MKLQKGFDLSILYVTFILNLILAQVFASLFCSVKVPSIPYCVGFYLSKIANKHYLIVQNKTCQEKHFCLIALNLEHSTWRPWNRIGSLFKMTQYLQNTIEKCATVQAGFLEGCRFPQSTVTSVSTVLWYILFEWNPARFCVQKSVSPR